MVVKVSHITWCKGRLNGVLVKERLDRVFFFNVKWLDFFPDSNVLNLESHGSDDSPIVIDTHGIGRKNARLFRYEQVLEKVEGYGDVFFSCWQNIETPKTFSGLMQKLNECRRTFVKWSRVNVRNSAKMI